MSAVLNIAAYKFIDLPDAPVLRERLARLAAEGGLKGTILLAPEGINLFLAGASTGVEQFLLALGADARFADLQCKRSWSQEPPFRHLRVKLKAEIIRMNRPSLRPALGRAPAVDAHTLARWLAQGRDDSGRPVVLLDTRNAFEADHGTFEGAVDWRLSRFSDFPQALQAHRHELAGKTVVSFCTGGIRCEKAALHMRDEGLDHVYQLDGGILRYFELAGSAHFRGSCFVFDQRESLDTALRPQPA